MRYGFVVTSLVGLSLGAPAAAAVINVPGDQPTIQAAITVAGNNDEIVVAAGTYPEAIDFLGKDIVVRSVDGAAATVIDASGLIDTPVVTCISGEPTTARLDGFTLTGGSGFNGNVGGGLRIESASPRIENCIVTGNATTFGAGVYVVQSLSLFVNCLVSGNSANEQGGGLYVADANIVLSNCTVTGNSALSGGGIYNIVSPNLILLNCILWQNSATTGPELLHSLGGGGGFLDSDVGGSGGSGPGWDPALGTDFGGNIDADPLIFDDSPLDARLRSCSPCVDAGGNASYGGLGPNDLAGNPRFVDVPVAPDTGGGTPPIIDMGAYERQDPDGGGVLSVPGAFPTIQSAVNAACDGDEVLISIGTYVEAVDTLGKAITLRAFFPATEWDPLLHSVIAPTGFSFGVTCDSGEGPLTVVEGLAFSGENGLNCLGTGPTVRQCLFATTGFGMDNSGLSDPIVDQCDFIGGSFGMSNTDSTPLITNSTFEACTFSALSLTASNATVVDCILRDNAPNGAVFIFISEPLFERCIFQNNTRGNGDSGGAIKNFGGEIPDLPTRTVIIECGFFGNAADGSGGAISTSGADTDRLYIADSSFSGNTAPLGADFHNSRYGDMSAGGFIGGLATGDFLNAGRLFVGSDASDGSIGTLTFDIPFCQDDGLGNTGSLHVDLAGPAAGTQHDQVIFQDDVDLAGSLELDFISGFDPTVGGAALEVITSTASVTGRFGVVVTRGLPAGKLVTVDYGGAASSAFGPGPVSIGLVVLDLATVLGLDNPQSFSAGDVPANAVAGRFNADVFPDLAIAVPSTNSIFILDNLGTTSGTWNGFDTVTVQEVAVGTSPSDIVAATLDGDAVLDLAVTNAGDGTVTVLLNDGSGSFTAQTPVATGPAPSGLVAAPLDGNASVDLCVSHAGDGSVRVLTNDGSASFTALPPVAVADELTDVGAGDVDAGSPFGVSNSRDVVVTNRPPVPSDPGSLILLTNNGSGTLTPSAGGGSIVGIAPGILDPEDLDHDKNLDVVTMNVTSEDLTVLLGNGDGTFASALSIPVGGVPSSLELADLDGDTDTDIIVTVDDPVAGRVVRVFRNDLIHDGIVEPDLWFSQLDDQAAGQDPLIVVAADVDQMGEVDVVTVNDVPGGTSAAAAATGPTSGSVAVLLNTTGPCTPEDCAPPPDDSVDIADLLRVLADWGSVSSPCDVDGSGLVDVGDLLDVLAAWGPCP